MKVKAIDWSYGNIGAVWVLLDGGSCHIDWGDNQTSALAAPPYSRQPEWCGISHSYPVKSKEIQSEYYIVISSDENNIIGINAASGEMNVKDIDIKACQSIRYFRASWLHDLTHIAISNRSALKKFEYDDNTPLSGKYLEIIKRIIERNNVKNVVTP